MRFKSEDELLNYLTSCYESKNYVEGLNAFNDNEDLITKKYYEIIKYKILILLALNKYVDAALVIKNEQMVPYIPRDFEAFLIEKAKEVNYELRDNHKNVISVEDIENIDKLDNETLINILPALSDYNLNKFTTQFQNIFNNENINYLTKTLLIASLSDSKLDYTFNIKKENQLCRFNPINLIDVRNSDNYLYIKREIDSISNIDINCQELIEKLTFTYLLYLYPLQVSEDSCDEIITAAIMLANIMTNQKTMDDKHVDIMLAKQEKITLLCEKINKLIESIC